MPEPKTGRKKDETRVVMYLPDDLYAILAARAERYGLSANLYAKGLLEETLSRDTDGVLSALNLLAEKLTENTDAITRLRADVGHDLTQIAEAISEVLDGEEGG